jgi:hypothetical protein
MGFKRTWYASAIGEVWRAVNRRDKENASRRSVFLPVTLDERAPAKDVGRPVMVRMAATVAIDLGYRMIREGRQARRDDIMEGLARGPLYADEHSRRGMVRRFLADYAEETGAQNDELHAQVADLIADLLVLTDRDGVDREFVIRKACEYADEAD